MGKLVIGPKLEITSDIVIPESELELSGIRAQGPGGQNVNKVSSAIQLKFDINASTALPADLKLRLMKLSDRRISRKGVITIKAQRSRSQDKNRIDALKRLRSLILQANEIPKKRIPTRPSKKAKERRLEDKARRARLKQTRGKTFE